jgi:hypothetical protein
MYTKNDLVAAFELGYKDANMYEYNLDDLENAFLLGYKDASQELDSYYSAEDLNLAFELGYKEAKIPSFKTIGNFIHGVTGHNVGPAFETIQDVWGKTKPLLKSQYEKLKTKYPNFNVPSGMFDDIKGTLKTVAGPAFETAGEKLPYLAGAAGKKLWNYGQSRLAAKTVAKQNADNWKWGLGAGAVGLGGGAVLGSAMSRD